MRPNRVVVALFAFLLILLLISIALNVVLIRFGKQYYSQLNGTRLDPIGLSYYPTAPDHLAKRGSDTIFVVFFGDSRIADWPLPNVSGFEFVNRGIASQTSSQLNLRYADHISLLRPDVLVVQMCINDLKTIPLFPKSRESIIANCEENIRQIVRKATEDDATVVLSTVFPVGQVPLERKLFWSGEVSLAVEEVNSFIRSSSAEQVVVFDAFRILADESTGESRKDYSLDELHFNAAGYAALNRELERILRSIDN